MKKLVIGLVALAGVLFAGRYTSAYPVQAGWVTLFDGSNLNNWTTTGDAKFKIVDGAVETESGSGLLVTKESYKDFEISAEFWVDEKANSGIFIRGADPKQIGGTTSYEVNIYDSRPDPTYATGAIVNVAPPKTPMKAAGKWNTFVIKAQGAHLTVTMNGVQTVDVQNSDHPEGYIALQYGSGVIRFRNVKIRRL